MRMAITADLHLNNSTYGVEDKETGLPIRTIDSIRAFKFFVDSCISLNVDRAVIIGDVFDDQAPINTVRQMFNEQIQKLANAKIQSVIVVGNHDACNNHNALMPLKGWNRLVKIVDKEIIENSDSYSCIYVPHTVDVHLGKKTFPQVVREVVKDSSALKKPRIFFGHFSVNGGVSNDYKVNSTKTDVSIGDILSTGADIGFLGHFHKFQRLDGDTPIYYVGSIERHDMSDTSNDRGFTLFDTETMETDRVQYNDLRPMKKIYTSSYSEAMKEISDETSWANYIVKVDFAGDKIEYAEIKSRFSDIRREFKSRGGLHIYMADVKYVDDKNEASDKVETVDQVDIKSMIRKNIESDYVEGEERNILISMSDKLWNEVAGVN